ncbi:MAG: hypothetical protein JWO38_1046 [Gemmataceae bacterium]|nr:hypothetical protein [Gemmataceae bacterium]
MVSTARRALVVCVGLALTTPAARADRIDAKLHENAPAILAALNKQGVKTVGVLRFRAERGKKPESFDTGPINDGLAARVENLLVIHADRGHPVGVLRDPNHEAAANKLGHWFTNTADRKKLFDHAYNLAWGDGTARPDAFLTGEVRCTGDMVKTTVVVEMFTAANPTKLVPVVEFTVDTDRLILADLGQRFNVARRGPGVRRAADLDRFAIGEARRRDGDLPDGADPANPPTPTDPPPAPTETLTDIGGVSFQLLSGDAVQTINPAKSAGAKWEVTSPPPGQPVTMVLKNTSGKRLGVVLKVNEVSTIFEQVEDSALCRKWVLEPGKEIKVKGFYQEGKQVAPFKILVGDEARQFVEQQQLGDKAGKIRVEVFAEAAGDDDTALAISLPRRMPEGRIGVARRDLASLQTALMKPARVTRATRTETVDGKAVKREIIVPDKQALQPSPELKEVDFKPSGSPVAAELIQIVKP